MEQHGFVLPVRGADGIFRFSRETAEDVARFRTARLIAALEKRAHVWIGRGLKANIKLGRIFIRLKELVGQLVGHGHFTAYYERTFGKRYGIPLRTAQAYMQAAREAGLDTKNADSALFPLAMDPQAVEIREATKTHQLAVDAARSESSDEAASDDEHPSRDAEQSNESGCVCRLGLRVAPEQRTKITALWRSENRVSAEREVIQLLMELCNRYEASNDSSSESEEEDE